MPILMRHPGEYEVWKDPSYQGSRLHAYRAWWRVVPETALPEGWVKLATIEQTMANPKYWGLPRYGIDGVISS